MFRHSVLLANLILISLISFSACEVSRDQESIVQADLSPSGEDVPCFGSSCLNPEEPDATKVKRDTKELVKAFSEDQEQADAPYPYYRGAFASASATTYPSVVVWTGTAVLSVITSVLARI